jgi:ribosome-associated translation inhibitor RaiA
VNIVFQSHHAVISTYMRGRTERAMEKVAERYPRAVDATVRFEQDGPGRRVEIVVHGRGSRRWVAEGSGRTYGPALTAALKHLQTQLAHDKRIAKDRARLARRA